MSGLQACPLIYTKIVPPIRWIMEYSNILVAACLFSDETSNFRRCPRKQLFLCGVLDKVRCFRPFPSGKIGSSESSQRTWTSPDQHCRQFNDHKARRQNL